MGGGARSTLTPRQEQVLDALAGGATIPEIATRLGISERAVEHHLQRVYWRLSLASDANRPAAAVVWCLGQEGRRPEGRVGDGR
jgi:DNA-binding NarL/FixJ family response regulator